MGEGLIKIALDNPVTCVPIVVLSIQLFVKLVLNAKARDAYGLYLSFSYIGVELSLLTVVTYVGMAIASGRGVLGRIYSHIQSDGQLLWVFLLCLVGFLVPLAVCLWLFGEAGQLSRDRFSILLKAPAVKKMFLPPIAVAMLRAVANDSRYYRGERSLAKGLIISSASIALGVFSTALFIKLIVEGQKW